MRIFITGIACVGKTTIGALLAETLGWTFFNLDTEIEQYYGMSIPRLRANYLTEYGYLDASAKVLVHILDRPASQYCVIAMPSSALQGAYLRVLKKTEGVSIVLQDTPERILQRITFNDDDSRLKDVQLSEREKKLHLKDIKKDITYYRTIYRRASLQVDISGCSAEQAAGKVLTEYRSFESTRGESSHRYAAGQVAR